jgi:hypothetical protein
MKLFQRQLYDWRDARDRIIGETSDYINQCLRDPNLAVRIPAAPAERARWTREFAETFWASVL